MLASWIHEGRISPIPIPFGHPFGSALWSVDAVTLGSWKLAVVPAQTLGKDVDARREQVYRRGDVRATLERTSPSRTIANSDSEDVTYATVSYSKQ